MSTAFNNMYIQLVNCSVVTVKRLMEKTEIPEVIEDASVDSSSLGCITCSCRLFILRVTRFSQVDDLNCYTLKPPVYKSKLPCCYLGFWWERFGWASSQDSSSVFAGSRVLVGLAVVACVSLSKALNHYCFVLWMNLMNQCFYTITIINVFTCSP